MIVADLLKKGELRLAEKGVPEPRANAEFLMAAVLKTGRASLALHAARAIPQRQQNAFWNLILERARRLPLAYVLGSQPFCGLDIRVAEGALVPRPETEELVEEATRLLKPRAGEPLQILELGTGTGCIAVALATRLPYAHVWATDISPQALKLAQKNAELHHVVHRIRFVREDIFKPDHQRRGWADMLISNPPYIPTKELKSLQAEVLKEPVLALDGGPDGLQAIRAIIHDAPSHLKPGACLLLEIGRGQGQAVARLLEERGFAGAMIRQDAQGQGRIAVGTWPAK